MRDQKVTHKIMSAIKSKNTRPELMLRKVLWQNGLRYRANCKDIIGKPDVVFAKYKIAIFCDGDFWHGHNWAIRGKKSLDEELSAYSDYWRTKILNNVARDQKITQELQSAGWKVIRIWESDIKKDVDSCYEYIRLIYDEQSVIYQKQAYIDLFGKCLWKAGVRYRKKGVNFPVDPAFYITKYRIVIYIDAHEAETAENEQWFLSNDWTAIFFELEEIRLNPENAIQTIKETILDAEINNCIDCEDWSIEEM